MVVLFSLQNMTLQCHADFSVDARGIKTCSTEQAEIDRRFDGEAVKF